MNTLGDYPPGAANDPRAPWNEIEPDPEYCDCGNPAYYYKRIPNEFPDGMPFDEIRYYCATCILKQFDNYIEEIREDCEYYGDPLTTFKQFLTDENINEL